MINDWQWDFILSSSVERMASDSHDHNQIENTKTANMEKKDFFYSSICRWHDNDDDWRRLRWRRISIDDSTDSMKWNSKKYFCLLFYRFLWLFMCTAQRSVSIQNNKMAHTRTPLLQSWWAFPACKRNCRTKNFYIKRQTIDRLKIPFDAIWHLPIKTGLHM